MGKASKLGETLRELDTTHISSEEIVSWKTYLDDVKESIQVLKRSLIMSELIASDDLY